MSGKIGKIDLDVFNRFIMNRLGKPNDRLLTGPRTGVDAAVIRVGDKALVVAEDPIFPAAGLPLETFGWFTMHIGASDVAVMGVKPEFATYSLLLTCPADASGAVVSALAGESIPCTRIGTVTDDTGRRVIQRRGGREEALAVPHEDPFWPAFFRGVEAMQT